MSLVTLVSGGLDSTLMAVLAKKENLDQLPLFIDYGHRAKEREWDACQRVHKKLGLPTPKMVTLSDFGKLIPSGLTDIKLDVNKDAFLPGRNLLFLLVGSAYAFNKKVEGVAIGLLSEKYSIFPDQTQEFIDQTQKLINLIMMDKIKIVTPLMQFSKAEVIQLAQENGIEGTYSCHSGTESPCGICISCKERQGTEDDD